MAATVAPVVREAEELDLMIPARAGAATVAMGAMAVEVAVRMMWLCVARLAVLEAATAPMRAMEWKALLATTPILLARTSMRLVAEVIELMVETDMCITCILTGVCAAVVEEGGMVARVVTVLGTTVRVTAVVEADMERLNWLEMEKLGVQQVQRVD